MAFDFTGTQIKQHRVHLPAVPTFYIFESKEVMRDLRISFRSRELAAVLAFLLPGAGHFYQGRKIKAAIFSSGILTLFFGGMMLADWQPVYSEVVFTNLRDS